VQLLVAVKQRQTGVIRNKTHFGFLIASEHHDIFQYSRHRLSRQAGQFKAVPMQMDRMDIITPPAITAATVMNASKTNDAYLPCHRRIVTPIALVAGSVMAFCL
jgi:hypothetical protein